MLLQSLLSTKVSLIIEQNVIDQTILNEAPMLMLPSGLILTPTIFGHAISGVIGTDNFTDLRQGTQRYSFVAEETSCPSKGNNTDSKQHSKPERQGVDNVIPYNKWGEAYDLSWIALHFNVCMNP